MPGDTAFGMAARSAHTAQGHPTANDSTGAVCGNLLGAHHGDHRLPHEWLERVEGRAEIAVFADDFAAECVRR
ncbi:hypothetical protein GCM10022206_38980 [Streptomyces chiangmaiensis]